MLKDLPKYVEIMFTSIFDSGPEELKYVGMEMARPYEAYIERTKVRSGRKRNIRDKHNSRIAPTKGFPIEEKDFYMVKIYVSWHGEIMETKQFLPFPDQDGLLKINGSTFSFSPVLADRNISVTKDSVFVPLELREKLTFRRTTHTLYKNGILYTATIANENIYRGSKNKKSSLKQILPHFLFAKYGLVTAFKKFLDTDIVVGEGDEINNVDFPIHQWDIYESTREKPAKFARVGAYVGSEIKFAIKRKDVKKHFLLNQMIGGAYYLIDRFPERIERQHIDNPQLWRRIFAIVIKDKNTTFDVMLEQADRNIRSIDTYVDPMTRNSFKRHGVEVDDFYELLAYIGEIFTPRMRSAGETINYYDKKLILLRYICESLIYRVNQFVYTISRYKANKPDRLILPKSIKQQLSSNLYPTILESINDKNACINSFSTSSDNKLFDLSTLVIQQSDYNRPNKKNKISPLDDASKKISASMLEVLSPLGATKNEPAGTNRLNPFVIIDKKNGFEIVQREELRETVDRVRNAIGTDTQN